MNDLQKQPPWRSEKYLKYIRSLPCVVTGRTEHVVAHHITTSGSRGTGTKPDDFYCIPLTAYQHQGLHCDPRRWEQSYGTQLMHWQRTISQAIRCGGLDEFTRWADGLE